MVIAFDRYKKYGPRKPARCLPPGVDGEEASRIAENLFLARDLINAPANDMGPAELEASRRAPWPRDSGAKARLVSNGAALSKHYPIDRGGRCCMDRSCAATDRIQLGQTMRRPSPSVGKGVCFDSGGLDVKVSAAMLTMKKGHGAARPARWRRRAW